MAKVYQIYHRSCTNSNNHCFLGMEVSAFPRFAAAFSIMGQSLLHAGGYRDSINNECYTKIYQCAGGMYE